MELFLEASSADAAASRAHDLAYEHEGDRVTQPYGWFGSLDEPAFGSSQGAAAKQAAVKQGSPGTAAL